MVIVAMTREMGGLGTSIGMDVAGRLGYAFVREDITREAAREYAVEEEHLIAAVRAADGAVTLAGAVGDDADVDAALAVARAVAGVTRVASEVQIVRMPVR